MSVSRMRDSDAERFSTATPRLLTVCSRRFWTAPNWLRCEETVEMAKSIDARADAAAEAVLIDRPLMLSPVVVMALTDTEILSLAALVLPTWKVKAPPALSSDVEPYLVLLAMRSISDRAEVTSASAAARDSVSCVPLADCTARSRTRCKSDVVSFRAPSAVCSMLMPSCAFCMATLKPPTWERSFSLIDRPAASSAARLMRKPEESFSRLLDMVLLVLLRWR